MIVRDVDGKLIIISRKECRNEKVYNEKLYNIRIEYCKKYKSVFVSSPKDFSKTLDKS